MNTKEFSEFFDAKVATLKAKMLGKQQEYVRDTNSNQFDNIKRVAIEHDCSLLTALQFLMSKQTTALPQLWKKVQEQKLTKVPLIDKYEDCIIYSLLALAMLLGHEGETNPNTGYNTVTRIGKDTTEDGLIHTEYLEDSRDVDHEDTRELVEGTSPSTIPSYISKFMKPQKKETK